VALQWVIQDVSSNVELANLTNVSKRWRQEVQSFITTYPNAMSSQLLLPSLAKHIIDGEGGDAFCATWLPPEGIQTVPVPSSPMEGSTNRSNHHPHMSSYGNNAYNRNHEIKKESFRDCCYEWRGYRTAHQILLPFGYSKKFVNKFVAEISCKEEEEKEDYQWTTSSVRGATYARPEAYCPCWDANSPSSNEFEKYSIRKRILHHRQQWLPRAIQSSPFKNPMQPLQRGQQQPSIQLLNASGSSAVRLLTPPFDCGPLAGPITLFCVAIATEDGCFLSGLTSKCEFGHLYPQTEAEHLIDRSPICVAMDGISDSTSSKNCRIEEEEDDDDSSEDEDGSIEVKSRNEKRAAGSGFDCACCFNLKCEQCDDELEAEEEDREVEEEESPPNYLYKGQRGPGEWHCYVAIIDGEDSTIRINGAAETMSHYQNKNVSSEKEELVLLDGVTIGSDTSFDMSLCYGDGSMGEGDGAISELIVFQGRLPEKDIEALEQHLMKKHGIPSTVGTQYFLQQEDDWRRCSRALIEQAAPYRMRTDGIPLHAAANDHSVAWERTCKVTGEKIPVGRIGSRLSSGSSDW